MLLEEETTSVLSGIMCGTALTDFFVSVGISYEGVLEGFAEVELKHFAPSNRTRNLCTRDVLYDRRARWLGICDPW